MSFSYLHPSVTTTDSALFSKRTKTLVITARPTCSQVNTSAASKIHPIRMIPHLITNLTDITPFCVYHQGSPDNRFFLFFPNNLIPIVLLFYDMVCIWYQNFWHTALFRELKFLRIAIFGKCLGVSGNNLIPVVAKSDYIDFPSYASFCHF